MAEQREELSQLADAWRPATFYRAIPGEAPKEERGYEWRGLALRHGGWATPRSETRWTLIHTGSGATIMRFIGSVSVVMPVAGEIAQCSDWTLFDLPEGWKQTDPELPTKVAAIIEAHPEARPERGFVAPAISDSDARAVIEARERPAVRADPRAALMARLQREQEEGDARMREALKDQPDVLAKWEAKKLALGE